MAEKTKRTSKELSVEEKIKQEIERLEDVFVNLDDNKKTIVKGLINNAAFTRITLEELQKQINIEGVSVEYHNGGGQSGTKQSEAVKTHIAMTKNLTTIIKQLTDLVPEEQKKGSKLDQLRNE